MGGVRVNVGRIIVAVSGVAILFFLVVLGVFSVVYDMGGII